MKIEEVAEGTREFLDAYTIHAQAGFDPMAPARAHVIHSYLAVVAFEWYCEPLVNLN